jgi:hypothetical protein
VAAGDTVAVHAAVVATTLAAVERAGAANLDGRN